MLNINIEKIRCPGVLRYAHKYSYRDQIANLFVNKQIHVLKQMICCTYWGDFRLKWRCFLQFSRSWAKNTVAKFNKDRHCCCYSCSI